MAINLKSKEADRLARELAALTGESLTDAITTALEQRLERERRQSDRERRRQAADRAVRRIQALPVLDDRPADELLGYDEFGLPT